MSEERFDRMENLMHLLIGSFTDFRGEMLEFKQQTNERFDRLESRMDAFEEKTNERFDRLESRMDAFEEKTNERFDRLESRMDAFEEKTNVCLNQLAQSLHEVNSNVMYLMPTRALHGTPRLR